MRSRISSPALLLLAFFTFLATPVSSAVAASATEINIKVDVALQRFQEKVNGGNQFLKRAQGVLVFPSVIKVGIGLGGEYGEGALRIHGRTVDYYNTAAASIGFQLGAQSKTVILVFLESEALNNFRKSNGWKAGVDGSGAHQISG